MNDKIKGKQTIPYPELLDSFGGQIAQLIKSLSSESIKPAIMGDVCKMLELLFALQQLMVMMYNLQVKNYEVQMAKIADLEKRLVELDDRTKKRIDDLETRLAGYSERLNAFEVQVKPFRELDMKFLKLAIQCAEDKYDKKMDE